MDGHRLRRSYLASVGFIHWLRSIWAEQWCGGIDNLVSLDHQIECLGFRRKECIGEERFARIEEYHALQIEWLSDVITFHYMGFRFSECELLCSFQLYGRPNLPRTEYPSTYCFDCGSMVPIADVWTKKADPNYALCESCFRFAETGGRAKAVFA